MLRLPRYLDAWRAGDYTSAFDNLHRYFDYTMHNNLDRSAYQFALLNLAIIQADFECFSEAISAVQEAVAIARESHDMNCLNFCMSWLYHFGKAFPEQMREVQNSGMLGNEKEGLTFLKAKSKETEMWSLLSTTLLSEAKLDMQHVGFQYQPCTDSVRFYSRIPGRESCLHCRILRTIFPRQRSQGSFKPHWRLHAASERHVCSDRYGPLRCGFSPSSLT